MDQFNLDLIFQETNLSYGAYTHGSDDYGVVTTDAPSQHHGGVAVFYRSFPQFLVKSIQEFGPNIVCFQLGMGELRWYIVGCYIIPDDTSTIEIVVVALGERPQGSKLFVAGYFNSRLVIL